MLSIKVLRTLASLSTSGSHFYQLCYNLVYCPLTSSFDWRYYQVQILTRCKHYLGEAALESVDIYSQIYLN